MSDVDAIPVNDMLLELRNRTIADIVQLQDFHVFTGYSYDRYAKMVAAGHLTGNVTNLRTSTTLADKEVADILLAYLDDDLPQVVLYQVVAYYETFFFDFLKILLQNNPYALSQKRQLAVQEVLSQSDLQKLILYLIERELHELRYKNVQEWFAYLERVINLKTIGISEINRLSELKATRDIVAHNAGIVNDIYIQKAGSLARARIGEAISVSRPYVYDSADFLKHLVFELTNDAYARLHQ
ncbi:MAG: hypothetical protein AB1427_19785 [Thermodesulfobacteriota bacterium]